MIQLKGASQWLSPFSSALNLSLLMLLATVASAEATLQPNIIVIMADDLGYADLGCYGCKDIFTPNIDRLAADGVRFTSAYVTGNMCGPSRAGFLTGRVQSTFGYYRNVSNPYAPNEGLPADVPTFASLLQERGYTTGGVGKWHMGTADHQHPNSKGFDDWFGFLGGGLMYFPLDHRSYKGKFTPLKQPLSMKYIQHTMPVIHNMQPVQWKQYLTRELTDAGIRFLNRSKGKPFFLLMSYNAPHLDLEAPEQTIRKYPKEKMAKVPGVKPRARSIYGAMVDEMDQGIGKLLSKVDELGIRKNTIIWFLSDHGGMQRTSDNRPLRGHKGNSYEGGLRVPLIVRWPGKIPAGAVKDGMISALDIAATSVAVAGGDPEAHDLHGKDVRDYLSNPNAQAPYDTLCWYTGKSHQTPAGAMREGDYKLLHLGNKFELYNLRDDLSERKDLSTDQPERVNKMVARWNQWAAARQADLWQHSKKAIQHADHRWLKGHPHYQQKD